MIFSTLSDERRLGSMLRVVLVVKRIIGVLAIGW